jgi:hypothetical protein
MVDRIKVNEIEVGKGSREEVYNSPVHQTTKSITLFKDSEKVKPRKSQIAPRNHPVKPIEFHDA